MNYRYVSYICLATYDGELLIQQASLLIRGVLGLVVSAHGEVGECLGAVQPMLSVQKCQVLANKEDMGSHSRAQEKVG
jgi:hypothetical protein